MSKSISDILRSCPSPSDRRVAIRVTPSVERTLRRGHPWLYHEAIRKQSHEGRAGDLAVIFDGRNRFLAIGLYDPTSPIRVRVLQQHEPAPINHTWYKKRLAEAVRIREPLGNSPTTGYRLVHGENDGLPGLVIDRYETTLVLKLYTVAWVAHLRNLIPALQEVWPARQLILRLSRAVQQHTGHLSGLTDGVTLIGPVLKGPIVFCENGLRFAVDPIHGQKTGFFLDQRENRAKVERLTRGRSVLDAFAYTGGFSVYAARGGAREVTGVDISRPALDAAQRNMALNRRVETVAKASYRVLCGDAFEILARLGKDRRRFDVVILDPPSFAKTHQEVQSALFAYDRLTRLGLGVLRPGGTLVASSCSGQVSARQFFATVHRSALKTGRPLQELERTGHALDHPISFKEGAYLKCLFATA